MSSKNALSISRERGFLLLLILSAAVLWVTPYLPMVDLPQHAAQVATLQELRAGNPLFSNTFEINWFAPYTLTYLVIYLLGVVLPITIAVKVLVTLAVVSVPLLVGRLLQETGGSSDWKILTIPTGFGAAFYWGSLPFLLAVPVCLVLLLQTVRYSRQPRIGLGIFIAGTCVLLFFLHVIALCFMAFLCVVYIATLWHRDPAKIALLWLPYTAPLPIMAYWYLAALTQNSYASEAVILWGAVSERIIHVLSYPAGLGGAAVWIGMVLVVGFIALPPLSGATLTRKPERLMLPVITLVVLLVIPAAAFGTIFIYQRLTVFLIPVWLLIWEYPTQMRPRFFIAAFVAVGLITVLNMARFSTFSTDMRDLSSVLGTTEPGKQLMYFPVEPFGVGFAEPIHFHSGLLYQAERRGVVDFNFAFFVQSMVRFKKGKHDWVPGDVVVWDPLGFEWQESRGEHYDYFLVRARKDFRSELFGMNQGRVAIIAQKGSWWLYKRVE